MKIHFFLLKIIFFMFLDRFDVKNNFLKIKDIILMHFQTKSTLKSNYYHTPKYPKSSLRLPK